MSAIAKAFSLKDAHSRIMCAKYVLISSDGTSGDLNECNWCNDTQFSSSKLCYNRSPTSVNSVYSSRAHSILFLWVEWCWKRSIVSSLPTNSFSQGSYATSMPLSHHGLVECTDGIASKTFYFRTHLALSLWKLLELLNWSIHWVEREEKCRSSTRDSIRMEGNDEC